MNIRDFFGFGSSKAPSAPEIPPVENIYHRLADSLDDLIKDITPLLNSLDEAHRPYVLQDFAVIMVQAAGPKLKEYHKFAFSILSYLIVQRDNSIIKSVKTLPEQTMLKIVLPVFDTQKKLFGNLTSGEYEYAMISLQVVDDKYHDRLLKTLYEFAEIVIKADGTVTPAEINNLKELNLKYLNVDPNITDAGEEPVDGEEADKKSKKKKNKANKDAVIEADTTRTSDEKITAADKPAAPQDIETILAELNDLVGLDNIKEDIRSLINILKSKKLRAEQGLPEMKMSLHAVFMGPPGTGKTTIARILANIYGTLGVLPGNNFIETDRSGMVGGYVGQTAIKTDKLINSALNGVLFIDEAYSLSRESDEDYGHEAIDTLLKRMEDHRDKLAVIVAGYEEEMTGFINSNPGLESRFSRYFQFKDYDQDQLTEIFNGMAKKAGFKLTGAAQARVKELFTMLYNNRDNNFGNARLVRNIFEKSFEKHANRTAPIAPVTREILITMEEADIPFDEFYKD